MNTCGNIMNAFVKLVYVDNAYQYQLNPFNHAEQLDL